MDRLVGTFVQPPHDLAHFTLAENLLRDLFRHRRLQAGAGGSATVVGLARLVGRLPEEEAVRAVKAAGRWVPLGITAGALTTLLAAAVSIA